MTDDQWVPGSKSELLSGIQHEWELLLETAEKLHQAGKISTADEGGWSPKDNLAHITEWMNILMGYHLSNRPAHEVLGVAEDITEGWDMEVINPVLFERNKDRTYAEVLDGMKLMYKTLVNKLESMTFEDLLAPRRADDPEKRPVLLWVLGDTTEHFAEHRATIEKML